VERRPDALLVALIRHGRTAANAERRFVGRTDVPLDDVGLAQAASLGARFAGVFDAVYASPLVRARQTAAPIGDPVVVQDLIELDQGALEGLAAKEAFARFPEFFATFQVDPASIALPGGESLAACADRAHRALDAVLARHRDGDAVAVVTHQMVVASIRCRVARAPLAAWRDHAVDNAAVVWLARVEGRLVALDRDPSEGAG
jgi:broad specificity phosphatase PhoE